MAGLSHGSQIMIIKIINLNYLIMIGTTAYLKSILSNLKFNASFFKTITFFSEIQAISSSLQKQKAINKFRADLPATDLKEFDSLMNHINKKIKIGITTKVVNNYYLKKNIPTNLHQTTLQELIDGGLANKLCLKDQESQLTLYDVNLFLRYIAGVTGTGSQGEKSQKIIDTLKQISKKQGIYFLKIIDHKITIGAKEKTFKNAKIAKAKEDSQPAKQQP